MTAVSFSIKSVQTSKEPFMALSPKYEMLTKAAPAVFDLNSIGLGLGIGLPVPSTKAAENRTGTCVSM